MDKSIPLASVTETAFPCPHCGAYAKQAWSKCYGDRIHGSSIVPFLPDVNQYRHQLNLMRVNRGGGDEIAAFQDVVTWAERMDLSEPFVTPSNKAMDFELDNLFVSECFNCSKPAIWVHDRLLYPAVRSGAAPNADLPEHILQDYEEARSILNLSPRGAAALLRLSVQKLCKHLGEKGDNINDDIASLIRKGLDPMIGEALDAVRVIGNEAVHPGSMNLNDDRNTAAELFDVVNAIVDYMISRPKQLKAIYDRLPPEKRKSIDERNSKALKP